MKRNELIRLVGKLIDAAKLEAARADTATAWARLGELERFCNDLCNVPTEYNRRLGVSYTMKEAVRKYKDLAW